MTTESAPHGDVPVIAEHDTWITVDPVVGCPANCSYCYLGPIGLKAVRPRERVPPQQAVALLREHLSSSRDDLVGNLDRTPVCIGNYTDMLLTPANQDYLLAFARASWRAPASRGRW